MMVDGKTEWNGAEVAHGLVWIAACGYWKEGCHRGEYANVLLAAKGPCVCSVLQALQIAISSVPTAVWCGSGVIVDGKTEWSGAEVADSLVCFAACGYGRRAVTAVSTR